MFTSAKLQTVTFVVGGRGASLYPSRTIKGPGLLLIQAFDHKRNPKIPTHHSSRARDATHVSGVRCVLVEVSIRPSTLCTVSSVPLGVHSVYERQPPAASPKDRRSMGSSQSQGRGRSRLPRTADRGAVPQAAFRAKSWLNAYRSVKRLS